ncbi:hypothetical protein [Actinomadura sp. WMMA1423]|uniref:hypothetical protein n=1 Tax=Actinomadura sp. WMMA1423 TaxID=2591108 RepID=UPI00143CFEBE|nr:hypothetical protein [Actinomadura sp. WMMA1423]
MIITGTGYVGPSIIVAFGGYPAVATVISDGEPVAFAPDGPGPGPVEVYVIAMSPSNPGTFTYV